MRRRRRGRLLADVAVVAVVVGAEGRATVGRRVVAVVMVVVVVVGGLGRRGRRVAAGTVVGMRVVGVFAQTNFFFRSKNGQGKVERVKRKEVIL